MSFIRPVEGPGVTSRSLYLSRLLKLSRPFSQRSSLGIDVFRQNSPLEDRGFSSPFEINRSDLFKKRSEFPKLVGLPGKELDAIFKNVNIGLSLLKEKIELAAAQKGGINNKTDFSSVADRLKSLMQKTSVDLSTASITSTDKSKLTNTLEELREKLTSASPELGDTGKELTSQLDALLSKVSDTPLNIVSYETFTPGTYITVGNGLNPDSFTSRINREMTDRVDLDASFQDPAVKSFNFTADKNRIAGNFKFEQGALDDLIVNFDVDESVADPDDVNVGSKGFEFTIRNPTARNIQVDISAEDGVLNVNVRSVPTRKEIPDPKGLADIAYNKFEEVITDLETASIRSPESSLEEVTSKKQNVFDISESLFSLQKSFYFAKSSTEPRDLFYSNIDLTNKFREFGTSFSGLSDVAEGETATSLSNTEITAFRNLLNKSESFFSEGVLTPLRENRLSFF